MRRENGQTLWCTSRAVLGATFLAVVLLLPRFAAADELANEVTIQATELTLDDAIEDCSDFVLPGELEHGTWCTLDVFNIATAIAGGADTILLENGPNGEEFLFDGGVNYVYITRPVTIEGVGKRPRNDDDILPLSRWVPTTRVNQVSDMNRLSAFALGTGGVTIRNLWVDSTYSGAIRRNSSYLPVDGEGNPFEPNPGLRVTIEDNVLVGDWSGVQLGDIEGGLDILDNIIITEGLDKPSWPGEELRSLTALMVWNDVPSECDVNIVGNTLEIEGGWWPVEFGGPGYACSTTNIENNTFTGSACANYTSRRGDAILSIRKFDGDDVAFNVRENEFVDLTFNVNEDVTNEVYDGSIILLLGSSHCVIENNTFENVFPEHAVISVIDTDDGLLTGQGNEIRLNWFRDLDLPGWSEEGQNDGPGCISLEGGAEYNVVEQPSETLPEENRDPCEQLRDLSTTLNNDLGEYYLNCCQ